MTDTRSPVAHLTDLNLLWLIHQVPDQDLGNYDALIRHAVRLELIEAGVSPTSLTVGEVDQREEVEEGHSCLVDVIISGIELVVGVTITFEEFAAIQRFGDVVGDFAEQALTLLQQPGQEILVGSTGDRTDSRIDLWLVDRTSRETQWHAEPVATCPDVLSAIRSEVSRRQGT